MALPAFMNPNRRIHRAPVNELDKSTIVSIYPNRIVEEKPALQPGRFVIEPGTYDNPSILVVGPSSSWIEIDESQPLLEIPASSFLMADSIVKDYCNGLFCCNMNDVRPGLFWIPGNLTVEDVKIKHRPLLDKYNQYQKNWFTQLVTAADSLWSRTNGNPLAISDDMRTAAQLLGLKDKPWIKDFTQIQRITCKACGQLNAPGVVVCPNCKVVLDAEKFKEMKLQFASA